MSTPRVGWSPRQLQIVNMASEFFSIVYPEKEDSFTMLIRREPGGSVILGLYAKLGDEFCLARQVISLSTSADGVYATCHRVICALEDSIAKVLSRTDTPSQEENQNA